MHHCMDCGASEREPHHHNCAAHEQDIAPSCLPAPAVAQEAAQELPIRLFAPYLATSTNVGTRQHWSKRKREVDTCHLLVRNAVRLAGLAPVGGKVDLVFRPRLGKGVRRRDTSNYSLNLKHLEDGLVAAGILPDDRGEYVRRVILEPPEIDRKAETGTWVEIIPVRAEAA